MASLADYFLFTGSIFYPLEHQLLRLPLTFSLPYLTLPYLTLPYLTLPYPPLALKIKPYPRRRYNVDWVYLPHSCALNEGRRCKL